MGVTTTAEDICEALDDLGFDTSSISDQVVDRFLSYCESYDLSCDQICSEYMAYVISQNRSVTVPSLEMLDKFEDEVISVIVERRKMVKSNKFLKEIDLNNSKPIRCWESDKSSKAIQQDNADADLLSEYGVALKHEDDVDSTPMDFHDDSKSTNEENVHPDSSFAARKAVGRLNESILSGSPCRGEYKSRLKRGQVLLTFVGDDETSVKDDSQWWKSDGDPKNNCDVTVKRVVKSLRSNSTSVQLLEFDDQAPKKQYFMFEKLRDITGCLDENICEASDAFAKIIRTKEQSDESTTTTSSHTYLDSDLEDSCFSEFTHISSIPAFYVGRISHDFSSHSKLTHSSVYLQGTMDANVGQMVRVNFDELSSTESAPSIFPGQMVCLRGKNPTGKCIIVSEIHTDVSSVSCLDKRLLPSRTSKRISASSSTSTTAGGVEQVPISVFIAAGPFTTSDNTDYEPLRDFLKDHVVTAKPQLLILLGPFVSERKSKELGGSSNDGEGKHVSTFCDEEDYDDVFHKKVVAMLNEYLGSPQKEDERDGVSSTTTKWMLIPSQKDAHHLNVYPQPPFQLDRVLRNSNDAISMPDPCLFHLSTPERNSERSNVVVGATSTDVMFHLARSELSLKTSGAESCGVDKRDRMSRIVRHLLTQTSFYPLYPPSTEVNRQFSIERECGVRMSVLPDLLILPSDLQYFIKSVSGTLAVNPGRLVKGRSSGGTFCRMKIKPIGAPRKGEDETEKFIKRVTAQIVRI